MNRRGFLAALATASAAALLPDPARVYSFAGGWAVDERYSAWDPRHWGVVGDGVHDDAPALQRMLDNVPVVLRGGVYLLSRPPVLGPGAVLDGTHTARLVRRNAKGSRAGVVIAGGGATLRNIEIDAGGAEYGIAIDAEPATAPWVDGSDFAHIRSGIVSAAKKAGLL